MNQIRKPVKYSVVIPVYNSASIVGTTIDRTVAFFDERQLDYEIVLVNDGSSDNSWEVIRKKAEQNSNITAINLLHNCGQHHANLCGFLHTSGDYVITMDDDLQNPPEEIIHLITKAQQGYDLVIGRFKGKKHAFYRRIGSILVGAINRRIFYKQKDLVLTNFRIIRRDVVERVCGYKTSYPYIPGLVLMFSNHRANVWVEHKEREVGKSNYNLTSILKLVFTILFNYSSYPLRLVSGIGIAVSGLAFVMGIFYLGIAIFRGTQVPGWTTIVVLLSFCNGLLILILSMIGEYVVRVLNQISSSESFHVKEIVRSHD
jgi:glycosyltransferase involved in cell wall biosynthesis